MVGSEIQSPSYDRGRTLGWEGSKEILHHQGQDPDFMRGYAAGKKALKDYLDGLDNDYLNEVD